jgi:hypothetical protein
MNEKIKKMLEKHPRPWRLLPDPRGIIVMDGHDHQVFFVHSITFTTEQQGIFTTLFEMLPEFLKTKPTTADMLGQGVIRNTESPKDTECWPLACGKVVRIIDENHVQVDFHCTCRFRSPRICVKEIVPVNLLTKIEMATLNSSIATHDQNIKKSCRTEMRLKMERDAAELGLELNFIGLER